MHRPERLAAARRLLERFGRYLVGVRDISIARITASQNSGRRQAIDPSGSGH